MTGVLNIQTTKEFGESTVSKILDLVENASSQQIPIRGFYLQVCPRLYAGGLLWRAGPGCSAAACPDAVHGTVCTDGTNWIYRALTFLVISCPCALVISIPLSFFAGIGGASKAGMLVKGSNYLETLSETKTVVFDKTGTLTQGVFEVNGRSSQRDGRRTAAGVRGAGGVRFLPSHQQEPAESIRQGNRPRPRIGHSGDQRQAASCAKVDGHRGGSGQRRS